MCMRPEGKQLCMLSCVSGCEAARRTGMGCCVLSQYARCLGSLGPLELVLPASRSHPLARVSRYGKGIAIFIPSLICCLVHLPCGILRGSTLSSFLPFPTRALGTSSAATSLAGTCTFDYSPLVVIFDYSRLFASSETRLFVDTQRFLFDFKFG